MNPEPTRPVKTTTLRRPAPFCRERNSTALRPESDGRRPDPLGRRLAIAGAGAACSAGVSSRTEQQPKRGSLPEPLQQRHHDRQTENEHGQSHRTRQ